MRKLTCHCGEIEIEINIKKNFEDLYRCNCSMCIRKGAITAIIDKKDLKVVKGMDMIEFIENLKTDSNDRPLDPVTISDCGVL